MKKLIFTLLIVFLTSGTCFSQARIGFTEQEIRTEYWYINWTISYGEETGMRMITGQFDEDFRVTHVFDFKGKTWMTVVYPLTNKELVKRITYLNNNTVRIDNDTWIDDGIIVSMDTKEAGVFFTMMEAAH